MAVEILILSGARRHERLVLEANEFRAGSDPACEVFFDPTRDPAAQGRGALVRKEDDGWYISPSGGDLTVNQQVLTGPLRLRSGDVIGLSASGPDFCFRLEAHGNELPAALAIAAALPQPATFVPSAAPTASPAERQAVAGGETRGPVSLPAPSTRQRTTWALGGLAACVLLAVLWRTFQPQREGTTGEENSFSITSIAPQHVEAGKLLKVSVGIAVTNPPQGGGLQFALEPGAPPGATIGNETGEFAWTPTLEQAEGTYQVAVSVRARDGRQRRTTITIVVSRPPPPPKPPAPAVELPREAVFLVEVEKAGRFWPFATGVAVAKDTLLTSAREAMQMATWRQKEGFKLWAVSPALGLRREIHEIRVHGVFATLAEKPNDWIYFDLALLGVEGEIPKIATLASPEDLGELKEGAPVRFLGFAHEGKKTPADRKFEPQMVEGTIFVTPVPKEDLPGRPRLLQVEAKIPPNVYGSPIFNERGNVVGVYGAPAVSADQDASPADAAMKDIHFAAIPWAEVVRRGTENRDAKLWIVPPESIFPNQSPAEGNNP